MTPQEWQRLAEEAASKIGPHIAQFVTPLSIEIATGRGAAHATGNYLRVREDIHLLTNEHVFRDAKGAAIGHLPGPTDDYFILANPSFLPGDVDGAIARVQCKMAKSAVALDQLDDRCAPVANELLAFCGCPGTTALRHELALESKQRVSWFDGPLDSPLVPMTTQERPSSVGGNIIDDRYIAIEYPGRATHLGDRQERDLPNAQGLSGSLLWDTKFVAARMSDREWSPSDARVCGLIRAVSTNPDVIIATRIEHVRASLVTLLRRETAYFHWIERGRPLRDAQVDWTYAVEVWPELR